MGLQRRFARTSRKLSGKPKKLETPPNVSEKLEEAVANYDAVRAERRAFIFETRGQIEGIQARKGRRSPTYEAMAQDEIHRLEIRIEDSFSAEVSAEVALVDLILESVRERGTPDDFHAYRSRDGRLFVVFGEQRDYLGFQLCEVHPGHQVAG